MPAKEREVSRTSIKLRSKLLGLFYPVSESSYSHPDANPRRNSLRSYSISHVNVNLFLSDVQDSSKKVRVSEL